VNIRQLKRVIGVCLLGGCTTLSAAIFEPGAGLGWQYSDNVALTPDDEEADWGAVGYLGGSLIEEGGPLTYNVGGTLTYQRYANKTFNDQTYFNLETRVRWEQVENRLNWIVDDFFTQSPVDSLGRDVPGNIQNGNVFNFGPDISIPLSSGHLFTINPFFRDFYYQDTDTDNQQYGLVAGWSYPMYPTMSVGINAGIIDVNYENDDISNYTISQLRAVVSGSRPHSKYSVNFGASRISRDTMNDQSGFVGGLDYRYMITGRSSVRARLSSDLTDSSQNFFNSELNPDSGNPRNVQTSGDIFRNNVFTLVFERDDNTFDTRIWGELRDINYDKAYSDREDRKVQEFGGDLDYAVNAYLSTGVFGSYVRFKQPNRTDKRYILGGKVQYNFSRRLSANAGLQYRDRNSTVASDNYNEFSVLVGIVYGFRGRTTGLVGDNIYQF
jgi:hypothetical protein